MILARALSSVFCIALLGACDPLLVSSTGQCTGEIDRETIDWPISSGSDFFINKDQQMEMSIDYSDPEDGLGMIIEAKFKSLPTNTEPITIVEGVNSDTSARLLSWKMTTTAAISFSEGELQFSDVNADTLEFRAPGIMTLKFGVSDELECEFDLDRSSSKEEESM